MVDLLKIHRGGTHPVDIHVGGQMRVKRKIRGLSQMDLAIALGVSFQQVQKYEKGSNRISASRLYETATILKVPVSYFFEEMRGDGIFAGNAPADEETAIQTLLRTPEGIGLARAFPAIRKAIVRQRVLELVRSLANDTEPDTEVSKC